MHLNTWQDTKGRLVTISWWKQVHVKQARWLELTALRVARMQHMKQKRAYKYRFSPTNEQKQNPAQTFGCVRVVYNWALRQKTATYYNEHERLYYKELSEMLSALKKQEEYAWLACVSSVPLQQALRHLDKAFISFFEGRAAYPQFKKKRNEQSATYTRNAFIWRDGTITLAKMDKPLAIRWSRPLPQGCTPSSVTVSKDCADRYFLSILVEQRCTMLQ